jgi:UDP-glucuronate decarboxylase
METDGIHDPVNLGNPGEFSIRELADEIAALCGKRLELEYRPLPQDDPTQRRPDITRAVRLLGWKPTIPLREGLRRTIPYFEGRLQGGGTPEIPFVERRRAFAESDHWTDRLRA